MRRVGLPFFAARGARIVALGAAVAALGACTDAPRRPLDPAAVERDLRARSLSDPALRDDAAARLGVAAEPWPPPTLDLALLTLAAWRFRPELAVAGAEVAAAEAKVTTAGAWSNPKISSSFGRVDDSVGPPWFLSAALDFTIPTAGKVSKREAVASQEVVLARLAAAQAAWRIYAEVRDALLEASVSASELDLARREAQVRATMAAQAAARVAAGAAASTEELFARVEADRARAGVALATGAQAQARAHLAAACGLPVAELEAATLAAPAPALEAGSTANDALLDRLDVRVVVAEYEAAERTLELELARQYPDVVLTPSWENDQGAHKLLLGFSVDVPIFDRNQGPIAEALAHRDAVAARFRERAGAALAAIDVAHAELAAAATRVSAYDPQSQERIAARHAAAERAVAAGASDRASATQLELEMVTFETGRLASERAQQASLLHLEDALQRPLDPSVARLVPAPAAAAANGAHE